MGEHDQLPSAEWSRFTVVVRCQIHGYVAQFGFAFTEYIDPQWVYDHTIMGARCLTCSPAAKAEVELVL